MKCGTEHRTYECEKSITTPPKCANCQGEHLSTYVKCSNNPNNSKHRKYVEAPSPKVNPWTSKRETKPLPTRPETTQVRPPATTKPTSPNDELALILGKIMITINSTNATMEQKVNFIKETEKLTVLFNNKNTK